MPLPQSIIIGNLTADPELRFTQSGTAVATLRVASQDRKRDGDKWVDGDTTYMTVTVWRKAAENAAESLTKGSRVVVIGRIRQREYETREKEKRTVLEVEADEIGLSLFYDPATSQRSPGRSSGSGYSDASRPVTRSGGTPAADDPWATPPDPDEPPF